MYSGFSYEKPVEVQIVSPGIYYHFGVADNINKYIDFNYLEDTIRLVIGVECRWLAFVEKFRQLFLAYSWLFKQTA